MMFQLSAFREGYVWGEKNTIYFPNVAIPSDLGRPRN